MNAHQLNLNPRTQSLIIVIDDNEFFRGSITKILSNDFLVVTFESPTDAMFFAEKNIPYAIMLDINMPNIDGFQVLSMLRSHPATSTAPVICISSTDKEETRQRAIAHGASGFMLKPFQAERLSNDIRGLVSILNKSILSIDGKRKFTICHSDFERLSLIKKEMNNSLEANQKVLVLSWSDGEELIPINGLSFIESEEIIFLQMKPQLIMKFPYLTEISSVIHDLLGFIDPTKNSYHLVFDEVRNLLNLNDGERALAQAYQLSQHLKLLFKNQSFFSTQASNPQHLMFQQKIARLFVNGEGG